MNKIKQKKLFSIALSLSKGIGPIMYKSLIKKFGSAEALFQAPKKELNFFNLSFIAKNKEYLFKKAELLEKAHEEYGIDIMAYEEADYPTRLKEVYACPALLYQQGKVNLNRGRVISIVGTRTPSAYGLSITRQLVAELKKYQPLIVSGLAYGIDITAHASALAHQLPTVAVVGGGLDHIYPLRHKEIATKMVQQNGGILSEHPLATSPAPFHFPARNKIIAAISDATIVIEAPQKSGALITAYHSSQFNRETFAVPGSIYEENSKGTHGLIKKHQAHLISTAEDLAYIMNWQPVHPEKPLNSTVLSKLTKEEATLLSYLEESPHAVLSRQELSYQSKISLQKIPELMLPLQLKGIVQAEGELYKLKRELFR